MRQARITAFAAAVLTAAFAAGGAAAAGEPAAPAFARLAAADPFSALVGKSRAPAAAAGLARYEVAGDGRAFLLEGRTGPARIQFLCGERDPRIDCTLDPEGPAEEIFLVTGVRGSRGEVAFRDHSGNVLLRLAPFGGATVFWPGRPQGDAASETHREDATLALPYADHQDAVRRAARAGARLSAKTGAALVFDPGAPAVAARIAAAPPAAPAFMAAPDAPAAGAAPGAGGTEAPAAEARVLADAVMRAAAGMDKVAADPTGARVLGARIGTVRFRPGAPPGMSIDGRVLTIIYDPSTDVAGRPSSRAVARFLEESL